MKNIEKQILSLINNFDGNVSVYACDNYNNIIKINENLIVEMASCIKIFILIEFYKQIMNKQKSKEDILIYNYEKDYLSNGSGIIQYLDSGLTLTSKNMAILMMIVSDNIATSKMIDYLGFDNINNTIKELGFKNTRLIAKKLDFDLYSKLGETTAYEYAKIFKMLLHNEILNDELCKEIINILKNQQYNEMLTAKLSPKYLSDKGTDNGFINYIASKSGGLGDEGKEDIINCRNDGGIISTKCGDYIVSIFINDFKDRYFYNDNPAILLGSEINKILFESIEKNSGMFYLMNEIELKIMSILDEIEYGFKDKNDINLINNSGYWENEFSNFYHLLSPSELLEKKCGVCWDQVELERNLFEEKNIKIETYFIYIDDNKTLPSHTFLTYKNEDDKYCWFEHSWYDYKGIHKYNNLKDLLCDVKNKFLDSHKDEINGKFKLKIYKYNKPNYNITCDQFYEFIKNEESINLEDI